MHKIILVGYMGSGKTEIGKMLAKTVQLPFFDLDKMIEERYEKTINEIFQEKGEIYFRKIEHEVFQEFVNKEDSFVLSLGGGTPCYANNHLVLQNDGIDSIYLKATVETLVSRLSINKKKRPIVKDLDLEALHEFIAKHLFDRSFYYNQSKYNIQVDDKSPSDVVTEIVRKLF